MGQYLAQFCSTSSSMTWMKFADDKKLGTVANIPEGCAAIQ